MANLRTALFLAAALCREGAATAEEPPATAAPAVDPAATEETPRATIPAAPPPASAPPPLVAQPAATPLPDGAPTAPVPAADPDAPVLRNADPRFGDPGQVALNGALSASVGHLGFDSGNSSNTNISVEPAFDYFAAPNFSQGVTAFVRYGTSTSASGVDATSTSLGVTLRVGQTFWLARQVSFWPKLAVGAWRNWLSYSAPSSGFTVTLDGVVMPIGPSSHFKEDAVFIEVQAPFLFHPARHFFIGFGPDAYVDVLHSVGSASNRRRFLGASSTIGGWF
jgi:hypothetical protein